MNVASLKLCKELYEWGGWEDAPFAYELTPAAPQQKQEVLRVVENRMSDWLFEPDMIGRPANFVRAYDLGYLLRKLPSGAGVIKNSKDYTARRPSMLGAPENRDPFNGRTGWNADTPENALCVMAIELFKQGVLTHE